jgi:hypothetical protein
MITILSFDGFVTSLERVVRRPLLDRTRNVALARAGQFDDLELVALRAWFIRTGGVNAQGNLDGPTESLERVTLGNLYDAYVQARVNGAMAADGLQP